jgi:hypothetical protein
MKLIFAIIVVLLIAAAAFGDYKWRQWIAARRRDRE